VKSFLKWYSAYRQTTSVQVLGVELPHESCIRILFYNFTLCLKNNNNKNNNNNNNNKQNKAMSKNRKNSNTFFLRLRISHDDLVVVVVVGVVIVNKYLRIGVIYFWPQRLVAYRNL